MTGPLIGQHQHNSNSNLFVYYQNVRGLKSKLPDWRNNMLLLEHNLVAATETYLDKSVADTEVVSGNWSILRRDRDTPCGGALLCARAPIALRRHTEMETIGAGEDLWASFEWRGRKVYVCVVYIKSNASDEFYMTWFCKVESFINNIKGIVLILGDLNLYTASLSVNNYYCYFMSFCDFYENNAIRNVNDRMLDVVLIRRCPSVSVNVETTGEIVKIDPHHPPLDVNIKVACSRHSDRIEPSNIDPSKDWNFKKCDRNLVFDMLSEVSWDGFYGLNDICLSTDTFYNIVYQIFDACIPKKYRGSSTAIRFGSLRTLLMILSSNSSIIGTGSVLILLSLTNYFPT